MKSFRLVGDFRTWFPQLLVESVRSPVEMIGAIVLGQSEGLTGQLKGATGDSICVAASDDSKEGRILQVAFEAREAESNVSQVSVSVGCMEFGQGRSVVADLGNHALLVGQGEELGRLAGWCFAKISCFHGVLGL